MKKIKMSKKTAAAFMSGILALSGAAMFSSAYLTDRENQVNEFSIGKVDIELDEPDWDPDIHTDIQPSEKIRKNPMITNTGVNDAYVYMEVHIPMRNVIAADADGNRLPQKKQELFSFTSLQNWHLMSKQETDSAMVYIYNYEAILKKGEKTNALFEEVTFLNLIEGQMDLMKVEIPVKAYAIQTENTGGEGEDFNAKAANAFTKYLNQNKEQEGAA